MNHKYGIIDIGSNTIRLVIYELSKSGRLKQTENIKAVARLRNYLTAENIFLQEGIAVLLETLQTFQEITRHHSLKGVKCVATAAIRQSVNKAEIVKIVEENTDFRMKILSEYEEAYYGYLAVVNSTSIFEGATIDIGGGSTEITYFKDRKLVDFHSFPFGVLSLKKQFVSGDIPAPEELADLEEFVNEQFAGLGWLAGKKVPVIGIGGSARNLVQLDQSLKNYPIAGMHQYEMNGADIAALKSKLSSISYEELQNMEGLSKERADIIIPALAVFAQIYETVDAPKFILSQKGLREGIFYEELNRSFGEPVYPSVVQESLYELEKDYDINLDFVRHGIHLAARLFCELKDNETAPLDESDLYDLKLAGFVYNLGEYIDSESSGQHTFYLLANRTIDGLSHKSRVKTALIASYKNKGLFKQLSEPFHGWFTKEELKKIRLLGALLKMAYSLNDTKRNIVQDVEVNPKDGELIFTIVCSRDYRPEQNQAEKQKKHLEKVLKQNIELVFVVDGSCN